MASQEIAKAFYYIFKTQVAHPCNLESRIYMYMLIYMHKRVLQLRKLVRLCFVEYVKHWH